MAIESILTLNPLYVVLGLFIAFVLYIALGSRHAGLEHIPGPFLAKYIDAWRLYETRTYLKVDSNYLMEIYEKYGDVVRVGPKTVAFMDPEAILNILGVKARLNKGPAYNGFRSSAGVKRSLVSIPDDKTHGTYRRPIAHACTLSSLKRYESSIDDVITMLIGILDKHADKYEPLSMGDWLYYWSFDVIGKLSFGRSIGLLEHGSDFNGLVKAHGKFLEYTEIVQERLLAEKTNPATDEKGQTDLLGHFIAAKKTHPDVVTDSEIIIYSGSNVAAGALATSRVLDKMILFLAQQPQARDRLHDEVRDANQTSISSEEETEGPKPSPAPSKCPTSKPLSSSPTAATPPSLTFWNASFRQRGWTSRADITSGRGRSSGSSAA